MIWPGQAAEHDADHGEAHEGGDGAGVAFEVAREAAVAADPRERALHDPAFGENLEVMEIGAFDDLELPGPGGSDGGFHLRSLISAVAIDQRDEGEQAARTAQYGEGAVAILHVGGMDDNAQEKAERIDEDVPLAARDLLARIKALRVERGAPF
jgi:uncharacterized protein with von Willebrand factor type A (vWA) domain